MSMTDTAKAAVRGGMQVIRFIVLLPIVIIATPIIAVAAIGGLWRKLELWAYYNGDEAARDRDNWRGR